MEGNCAPVVSTALLIFAFCFAAAALGASSVPMAFALAFASGFVLTFALAFVSAFVLDFASDVVLIFDFPAGLDAFVPAVFSFCWRRGCSSGSSSAEAGGVERTGQIGRAHV